MRTRTSSKKSLTDQAAELVEQVGPHVEAARERIVNDYLPAAQSMLSDAAEVARDVAHDAREAAQDAAANAEKSTRKSRKKAAKRARAMMDSAVAAAPEGLPLVEKVKAKPKRRRRFLLLLAAAGAGAIVVKRLRGKVPAGTPYARPEPAPRPTPVPSPPVSNTPPETDFEPDPDAPADPVADALVDAGPGTETADQGGAFLDEMAADADEEPHPVTTPDHPAETEHLTEARHSRKG
jgi:hypothetical protein